jgi:putative acetyltransferase
MSSERQDQPSAYRLSPRGEDLAPLADLWIASWQATLPLIDFAARRDWFCAYVAEIEERGGMTLCAFDSQDALSGFILIDIRRAILEQIAVAPALFGSGLGAFLLEAAKERCRAGLSLDVNMDNPRAMRFYEKHGFVQTGEAVNPNSGLLISHMHWRGR